MEVMPLNKYESDCLVAFNKLHSLSYQYTPVGKIEDAFGFAKSGKKPAL